MSVHGSASSPKDNHCFRPVIRDNDPRHFALISGVLADEAGKLPTGHAQ